jgi:hypothetical protein
MKDLGFQLVVVDNGFVYVGHVIRDEEYYAITSCHNVRKAGTTNGFGQLANQGPLKETVLDKCPTILVPVNRLCHFILCNADAWKAYM